MVSWVALAAGCWALAKPAATTKTPTPKAMKILRIHPPHSLELNGHELFHLRHRDERFGWKQLQGRRNHVVNPGT
jgi:hypothetical protein